MFKIGEFSKLSRISIRMLRHYDEIGLLVPEETDPWTGYRRYAAAQLMTANRITALRGLGFSLAETAALLACWEDRTAMETRLLAQRAAVEASIQEALDRLRLLDTTIERLRKDEKQMNYDVTIKTLPERQVASVRQILPCYDREGDPVAHLCEGDRPSPHPGRRSGPVHQRLPRRGVQRGRCGCGDPKDGEGHIP